MEATTAPNAWVSSYLDALLSYGLSSEYVKTTKEGQASSKAPDADRSLYSKYYVQGLLNMDEEALHNAWVKAASARQGGEKDARLQYLSWRIWHMKRKHARVKREQRAAELHEEESVITEPTSGGYSSDEEAEPKTPSEPTSRPSAAASPRSAPAEARGKAEVTDVQPLHGEGGSSAAAEGAGAKPKKSLLIKTAAQQQQELGTAFDKEMASPLTISPPTSGFEHRFERLYVVLISLHGLVRAQRMELGRDADTGGQVKYVVELAKAISMHPAVYRVDLLTRLIRDPGVDPDYGQEEECIRRGSGEHGGAYIVRLPCGPTHKYVRKELLWPHVREFADRGIAYVNGMLAAMAEGGRRSELYVVHGHYADAGEAAVLMTSTLNADMCMTGHSLGRNKLEHLLASGTMTKAEIEESYAISRRIEAEERGLDSSLMIFTSTQQEIDEQWGLYDGYSPQLSRVLKYRRAAGRHMPTLRVIPPGLDFSNLKVHMPEDPVLKEFEEQRRVMGEADLVPPSPLSAAPHSPRGLPAAAVAAAAGSASGAGEDAGSPRAPVSPRVSAGSTSTDTSAAGRKAGEHGSTVPSTPSLESKQGGSGAVTLSPRHGPSDAHGVPRPLEAMLDMQKGPPMWQEIARFLRNPLKPAILAMSRADPKKNVATLVKAFGQHPMLRDFANLVLIMGNRDNIDSLPGGSQKVMTQVLKLIDTYDLYGSVAYPKHHTQADISDIYLFCKETRGVFVNIALQEPFGLTVIEAAAHGVPTVATKNGGPVDIMATLFHGVIVDPTDTEAVAQALLGILTSPKTWDQMSHNGSHNIMAYSWPSHVKKYLDAIEGEKRFQKSTKKHGRTLSSLLGRRALPAASAAAATGEEHEVAASAGPSAELEAVLPMQRYYSTPQGLSLASIREVEAGTPLAGGGGIRKTISGVSNDDLALLQALGSEGLLRTGAEEPRAAGRRQLLALPLDSDFCVPQFTAALRAALAERERAGQGDSLGIGVLSMLGFESTRDHVEAAGLDMSQLDFAVCNSGADVWHHYEGGHWDSDEGYESLVDFEWDRLAMHRMLDKVVSQPEEGGHPSRRLPRLKELLYNVQEMPAGGVHPRHICMELDEPTQNILAAGMGPRRGAYAARGAKLTVAVMERLKRRMRSKGFRATYTLQQVPRSDGDLLSVLHITPLRASRPLALRYLAHKYGLHLGDVTLVALPPEYSSPRQMAACYVTDGPDLLAGMQQVVVVPAPPEAAGQEAGAATAGVLLESQGVSLEPFMFPGGSRVRVSSMDSFAAEALSPPDSKVAEAEAALQAETAAEA